jgi:hypothetical protein
VVQNATKIGRLRRNFMNALQIIPPKPAVRVRRSALLYSVLGAILLLVLVGGMSMSRGEEGTASEPGAPAEIKDSRDKVGDNDKSPSVTQAAAAPATATTEGSGSGGTDEKVSTSAQPNALSATSSPAGVTNDRKVGSESGKPAAAEAKSNTAVRAAINDRNTHDRNSHRALAKLPAISPASVASKNDLAPKPGDARVRKTAPDAIAARSAESVRRAYQTGGKLDYRSWKSADRVPVWVGPPPIIYGPGPEARAPYVVEPADATKRGDRMPSTGVTGMWERVVEAPGAVLDGGKQALYGVLDSIW